jgi:hypothetical protein
MPDFPPHLNLWLELSELLAEGAVSAAKHVKRKIKGKRKGAYLSRRPGPDETPMWSACVGLLRQELKPRGSKVRLARYLGIPKQRITDFTANGSRMPDAETLLQILNWLAQKRAGKDLSL